ncbi:fatty acid synthase-like [Bicyclus anynana]|uniref:Fatty acid synthase-like n=1 Tax=Bicyclus anynana TaxID=110368 RepID=A0ABM3LIG7_BICAN|nr:fatty acid synthase-like [Bicyclus anynana]
MAPTFNLPSFSDKGSVLHNKNDARVVISGMSGLYPESYSVKDLANILYNKINPINNTNVRWKCEHPEVAQYTGKMPGLKHFDAQFFKVHYRLSNNMDAMGRKLLEQSYQAIYDAGICPEELSGKKVGVYVGNCMSESEKAIFYAAYSKTGFGIAGGSKSMYANRISYWLNAKGPSMSIDEGCCSSTEALNQAYLAIKHGECEAAIVGGSSLSLHPQSAIHYGRILNLSMDGKTKSFDTEADGCAKSEAINVLFLQKAENALRIYAEVVHVKCTYLPNTLHETKSQKLGLYRDPDNMANVISTFYDEANISPLAVEYVEACGSATPEVDKAELEAIQKVYCNNRRQPLLVGSVMSNIGYCEAASGIAAITKVLIGYHSGKLAGNLNCDSPRNDVAALRDGRMRILTDHHGFDRSYTAVHGISLTGVNAHVLLYGHHKATDPRRYKTDIPHLVLISGRQETSVNKILLDLKSRPVDPEEIALLHNIHKTRISGHLGRGFILLDKSEKDETICVHEESNYFDDIKRPLWFVYSGMGSQWAGMGAQLMRIPIFAAAIEKCRHVLEPKGLDIVHIITSPDKTIFDNILNSFVGIAAIQIGLTDVLRAMEISPDKIIGHSVGELGCAYADGCLTAEEMILSAYSRGLVSVQTPFIRGSMAAVGLGFERMSKMVPPEIEIACHNGPNSSTISGPADIMKEFVAQLTAKKIFAKEVPCSNIAYHSRYIAEAGPALLKYLGEVITSPKVRSRRWVSTSVPQEKWNDPIAKYSSAEYHTNNLLNSVLFEETSRLIPPNAVVVEIAPHGLLQAILKRSLPESCKHVPLTRRGHPNNAVFLLEALGNLFMVGYNPKVQAIYPKVEFPVSTTTPMLSHLVEWAHHEIWNVPLFVSEESKGASSCNHIISIHDDSHDYLKGHVVRGKILYPFAAALVTVWDTLAMVLSVPKKQLSVKFDHVHLYLQPVLQDREPLRLYVTIQRGRGYFEVLNDNVKIATGFITSEIKEFINAKDKLELVENLELKSEEIYELLFARDYNYTDEFRSICKAKLSLTEAHLLWQNNWVTLIDGMIQLNALRRHHDSVSQPNFIRKMVIDVKNHLTAVDDANVILVKLCEVMDTTRCGGVIIENIKFHDMPSLNEGQIALKTDINVIRSGKYFKPIQENISEENRIALEITRFGDIDFTKWIEVTKSNHQGISVKVQYAGLSDAYIKKVFGVATKESIDIKKVIEYDFSGVTNRKERVMGIVQDESISTHIQAKPELLWPVPEYWTLEEAATVPLAYCLAFYCLCIKARFYHGISILVHDGSGALGQAIISIALAHDCDVYTTVSSIKKKRFLLNLFPELKEDHIGCSLNNSFTDMVLNGTKRGGCDIVIISLKGLLRDASIKCCKLSGYAIDTSLILDDEDYMFGLYHLTKSITYNTLQFSSVFDIKNTEDLKRLQLMVSEGIARGYVLPLSRVVYAAEDASRALQLQASCRHVGRVLLHLEQDISCTQNRFRAGCTSTIEQAKGKNNLKIDRRMSIMIDRFCSRISCSPDRLHILLSENAVMGMQLVERLVKRGGRRFLLCFTKKSRSLLYKIRSWENQGVQFKISYGNLWNEDVFDLLNDKIENVEGIYCIMNSDSEIGNNNKQLEHLNLAIRRLNWPIKYFAVIDSKGGISNNLIKLTEPHDEFITIKLPSLEVVENNRYFPVSNVIDAIEKAICNKQPLLAVYHTQNSFGNLVEELANLADFSTFDGPSSLQDVTLEELGMDPSKSHIVRAYLRDLHNVSLDESDIPSLTIKKIGELAGNEEKEVFIETEDLKTFLTHIDSDELLATTEIVFLPTLATSSATRADEFDVKETYLCIVPGVEGLHVRFRELCERIKVPALVLQPGVDKPQETIQEIAQRYTKILLKKTQLKKRFYFLGYESGVLVALEMAAILEDSGLNGTIFCIGGAPQEVLEKFDEKLAKFETEESLQSAVASHMFKLLVNGDSPENLDIDLKSIPTWKEKVSFCVQMLLGRIDHSIQYAKEIIEAVYERIVQVRRYQSQPRPLRSLLVTIRPWTSTTNNVKFHSLQSHSQQKVVEYQLQVPLAYAAQDMRCAAIVNRHLDQDILEGFDKKNLCETYQTKADSFVFIESMLV